VILYSGIIFYGSSISGVKTPIGIPHFDKMIHLIEYVPFGYLIVRAFASSEFRLSIMALYILGFSCSLAYGLSDEFHQSFVEGRNAVVTDVLADTCGGLLGSIFFVFRNQNRIDKN